MSHSFRYSSLQSMQPLFSQCTLELIEKWRQREDGSEVDIFEDLKSASINIIGRTAFGISFAAGEEAHAIIQDFETILEEIEKRSYAFIALPNWFYCGFTADGKRFIAAVRRLKTVVLEIVHRRKASGEAPGDLLDLLVQAKDVNGRLQFSNNQIVEEVMTFLFAGHETTSTGLSWTFYLLSKHPDVEKKVVQEIENVFGDRDLNEITGTDLKELKYLGMVFKESMRLYPPQPAFVRRALCDNTIRDYFIPAGTEVSVVPYLVHRNAKYWEHPEKFDPERFSPERSKGRHPFAFLPFSGGRRRCIGSNFAIMEAKIMLSFILKNFKINVPDDCNVIPIPAVTLRPHNLRALIRKR
eukprot:TRINITY_DN7732_c0_g1_i1.p1 TRINITY_DN7732_c0_g1~~TRINITY_DN7732_c0_g1_i1.p1  ORF type:complete len:388 (-),score=55.74 TRINITY_DN7732_c0_g1_i1:88-1152(-)